MKLFKNKLEKRIEDLERRMDILRTQFNVREEKFNRLVDEINQRFDSCYFIFKKIGYTLTLGNVNDKKPKFGDEDYELIGREGNFNIFKKIEEKTCSKEEKMVGKAKK